MVHKKSLELLSQVKEIIESYNFALTLRQIYYQLVVKQIVPNEKKYPAIDTTKSSRLISRQLSSL